ncbi:MAG: hypothetical protein ACREMA_03370 [Longimicrobiales bacterium]
MTRPEPSVIAQRRWVHVYEEDTERGAVYRPEDTDIPLSRRPRTQLELGADGSARVFVPGPDDRLREQSATWGEEAGDLVIRATQTGPAPGRVLRVVDWSADRLIVRT